MMGIESRAFDTSGEEMVDEAGRRHGCLVGGAIGDALGAPVEFATLDDIRRATSGAGVSDFLPAYGRVGAITDDTQMTMFTAEGLIRAHVRFLRRGICHVPSVVARAYARWLATQGETPAAGEARLDGWLVAQQELHARRAPGNTCLSALRDGKPASGSKGCGGVMRVAPVGLVATDPFRLGCELAALTHGHPTGYLSAGAFASIIADVYTGESLDSAIAGALASLSREADGGEVTRAILRARGAAAEEPPTPEAVERLGAGWVAEEALAIAIFCSLTARDFASGVLLAVNHSGDSDSTGSLTGNLLGTLLGEEALPRRWADGVEAVHLLRRLADDLGRVAEFSSAPLSGPSDGNEVTEEFAGRYPGS